MKDTVFILGAGASMHYGLPSGKGLIKIILLITHPNIANHKTLNADELSVFSKEEFTENFIALRYRFLVSGGFSDEEISKFRNALKGSKQLSIDTFIRNRPEFEAIGKLSITIALSILENPKRVIEDVEDVKDNWYEKIWHSFGSSFDDFKSNDLAFITFNYDRSLEFFLSSALSHSFNFNQ